MDHHMDCLMVYFMEPLMDLLTDKPTHLMGLGINPRISNLIMDLYHPSLKVPQITILTCNPIWAKWEDFILPLAKAMVYIAVNLM